jgi:hypothetical protein
MTLRVLAACLAIVAGCNRSSESDPASGGAPATGAARANPTTPQRTAAAQSPSPSPSPSGGAATTTPTTAAPVPGTVDGAQTTPAAGAKPVIHGEKWQPDPAEEGGRNFAAFRETWIYVDGVPKGALLFAELPVDLPLAWKDDVVSIDFIVGDPPPHEKKVQVLRWRLSDWFKLAGIDVAKIKMVYLHGSGYVSIPGPQFRKFSDGITFDLTGNDLSKSRFYWPTNMPTNTSYDRYAAVSVFIDKPPLKLDEHNNPFINDVEVNGIPYHGTPERGGFRVYVDYKLAMVVKRNELGKVGQLAPDRWNLMKLLEARGTKVAPVAGDLVVANGLVEQKRDRLDAAYVHELEIGVNPQASGTMLLGKDNRPATALHLYTQGHVPPVKALPPFDRDWQPGGPEKPIR